MQVHRFGVAAWQHEASPFTEPRADGTKDVGGCGALIVRRRRPGATFGPSPRDLVLLSDPGFVGEPDFYIGDADILRVRDFFQDGREVFLKASIAPST